MQWAKTIGIGAVAAGAALLAIRGANTAASPKHEVGPADGRLAPCPDRPNCVSSQAQGDKFVEPITLDRPAPEAWKRLQQVVDDAGGRIVSVSSEPRYLHAEFRTRLLGFVDDFELLIDEAEGVIHIRSASRVGRSDLGVNRKRVERLRRLYQQTPSA